MALTPEQEKALFEYVKDGTTARTSDGGKLDTLITEMRLQNTEMRLHFQKDELTDKEFRDKLEGHNSRITDLEDRVEDTSTHNLIDLKQKLKEYETKNAESSTWLKRWGIQTFVAVGMMAGSALIAYIMRR
jgi:uncharacterized coiled-coil protein SlyX